MKTLKTTNAAIAGMLFVASMALNMSTAHASLTLLESFNGRYGISNDGFGINGGTDGIISASIPAGSIVERAYLYTAGSSNTIGGVTFNGSVITFGPAVPNTTACCGLTSARADVTSLIKSTIDAGPGGIYNFNISEGSSASEQDGEALIVVYSNPTLPVSSVAILDGFSAVGGDTFAINFAAPLDPTDPSFFAEMALGIEFSCSNQRSNVSVNGTTITENAGNFDDGVPGLGEGGCSNGNLITVGGFEDLVSGFLPSYADDHERYDLAPYVTAGDTTINVRTNNPSNDDNIFLATLYVLGEAGFNEPPPSHDTPEPAPLALLGLGLLGLGVAKRRANAKEQA